MVKVSCLVECKRSFISVARFEVSDIPDQNAGHLAQRPSAATRAVGVGKARVRKDQADKPAQRRLQTMAVSKSALKAPTGGKSPRAMIRIEAAAKTDENL